MGFIMIVRGVRMVMVDMLPEMTSTFLADHFNISAMPFRSNKLLSFFCLCLITQDMGIRRKCF